MGILKVEDERQAATHTLSSFSNSCSTLVEGMPKGSEQGYDEAPERIKTKKSVRFEERFNQVIFFTSATTHASKKVLCLCAPATHVGSFKCRLHRENSNLRSSSASSWIVNHGSTGPKNFNGKVSQNGSVDDSHTQHSRFGRTATTNVQQVTTAPY